MFLQNLFTKLKKYLTQQTNQQINSKHNSVVFNITIIKFSQQAVKFISDYFGTEEVYVLLIDVERDFMALFIGNQVLEGIY